ncbi:MAG: hypothetical protein AB1643_01050 [Patescibacteria group bacterium]
MNKKIIIIAIVVTVILGLIAGGYFLFIKNKGKTGGIADIISGFFPTGQEKDILQNNLIPSNGENIGANLAGSGNFFQISHNPVSGAFATSAFVRYIEQSTGHIYEVDLQKKSSKRISNTTILGSFNSVWSFNGDKLVIGYLDESDYGLQVKNFSLKISDETATFTGTSTAQGIFLPTDTISIASSPSEDKIFYLEKSGDSTTGIIATFEDKKRAAIFSSVISEFNVSWPNKNNIALLTRPSAAITGFLYFIDIKTGALQKILGDIKGLTALVSPDGGQVFYSENRNNNIVTKIYDVKNKTADEFYLRTLPEKCVWSRKEKDIIFCAVPTNLPQVDYPDYWYQGLISFENDSIWKINFVSGETTELLKDTNLDIINPLFTLSEDYLIFINKKDNTLWGLKLK